MKVREEAPDSAMLRRRFGHRIPFAAANAEKEIQPGRFLKVYRRIPTERYILRPTQWDLDRKFRPPEQIAKHVDKRPLLQLLDERDELIQQILTRALCGDEQAISLMISTARGLVRALEDLEKLQPRKLKAEAEASSNWPVVLSLNPQDIAHAKRHLASLNVGGKATTPRRAGQRLDPQNFWTLLADRALKACEDNRAIVPALENAASAAKRERKSLKFWQTPAKATYYYPSNVDCIIITDWEKQCVKLSGPITEANFKQWWRVVQFCVLERWDASKEDYQAALARISDRTAPKESQKRNLAMNQVRKAFRSLVGLRQ